MNPFKYIYDRLRTASIVDGMRIVFGKDPKSGVCIAVISQSQGSELLINKCTLGFLGNKNNTAAAYVIYFGNKAALHMFMSDDDFDTYVKAHNDKITKIDRYNSDGQEMRPTNKEETV